ncbi:MAG: transposase, partial [Proteobacteria bacterium]|nr:transposase [Pseudomonadota bacterium]
MARAQCGTIRLKLLKIGAVIVRNTRRVRFHLSGACPDKALFMLVAARLVPG